MSRRLPLLAALVTIAAVAVALVASTAFADTEQHVKQASLDDRQGECVGTVTLWHFVITQVTATTAPASIHVVWDTPAEADVPLDKVTGSTAHYETTLNVGSLVTDATAVLPDDWSGEFNLSHVDCLAPVEPEISTEIHLDPGDTAIADPFEVALGSSVHDSATAVGPDALGDPTGDIDFTFYKGECGDNSNLLFTDLDVPLVDGVAHPSDSSGALGAGEYHFQAHYDSDNEAVWADSDSLCEPLTVNKAQLEIVTQIHDAGHNAVGDAVSVPLGSVVHDTATVTGVVPGFDPTGDISFTLNGNGPVGQVAAEAGYSATTEDSAPLGAGNYMYNASVAGDDNYFGDDSPNEPLTVDKAQLEIVTQIHDAGHNAVGDAVSVPLGSVVHDTATVTGVVPGFDPIGDISFTLNGNGPVGQVAAEAGYSATTEDSAPLGAGNYMYNASVAGDDNYFGDDSPNEPLTVDKAQLTIVTAIHNSSHNDITNTTVPVGTVVHDTATVTGAVAGLPDRCDQLHAERQRPGRPGRGGSGLLGHHRGLGSAGGRKLHLQRQRGR